eukprot:TRINITY_DN39621_c0_g1_i1.p1 TRINITY_DN39621_c0_g1~~TRINITY_DN39621_c0_g1_i1.p1  ORF type:complete len:356 (-),score=73.30 TRINITY_DN39621_c0_g1_i1:113-1180(-)
MNKAKAMLDALMGPSRDLAPNEKKDEWRDRSVCKAYLAGFCPYDKACLGGRRSISACTKIHNEILRESFNKHADGAADSSFRRDCEDKALRDIADVISLRDSYANEQRNNKNAEMKIRKTGNNKEVGAKKRKAMEIKEQADALDDTQGVEVATKKQQLLEEFAIRLQEYEAFAKEEEKKEDAAAPKASTCKVCGTAYYGDDEYNNHLAYKAHAAYLQVDENLRILQEKKENRSKRKPDEPNKDDEKADDKSKKSKEPTSRSRDRKKESEDKDEETKKKGKASRSRSKDKKARESETKSRKKGSRSRSRERSRDRKRNGRKYSRSKSRGRKNSRSRSRRGNKSSGRDRQRSRDRRR